MQWNIALKGKEILTYITTWMNIDNIILSEINKLQKRQILYDSTYMRYPAKLNS